MDFVIPELLTLTESLWLFPGDLTKCSNHSDMLGGRDLGLFHKDPVSSERTVVAPRFYFLKKTSYFNSVLICVVCNYLTF